MTCHGKQAFVEYGGSRWSDTEAWSNRYMTAANCVRAEWPCTRLPRTTAIRPATLNSTEFGSALLQPRRIT